jgi:regulator of cell morphogenesis and NO signaling
MYLTSKIYIEPGLKVSDLIKENPSFLLVLEHFGIDEILKEKTIAQLCSQYNIGEFIFTAICNFYNDFNFVNQDKLNRSDIPVIIRFLSNSHRYYKNEKYPEILQYIKTLNVPEHKKEMTLVELFFNEYFVEVKEHLEYEEEIVFPYFSHLYDNVSPASEKKFSASLYLDHHSDIESKLADLKNLLLNHLHIKNLNSVKRKLLYALFELEYDLKIHSMIEEQILIPLAVSLENKIH